MTERSERSSRESATVSIEKSTYGGDGLARLRGKALFVPYALPGEEVLVEVEEDKGDYLRGRLACLLNASPLRREAPCRFYPECGGCQYQHLQYRAQWSLKMDVWAEMIRRQLGSFSPPPAISHIGREWEYRRNVRLQMAWTPSLRMGFYRPRSRHIVDLEHCPLWDVCLAQALHRARCYLEKGGAERWGKAASLRAISNGDRGQTLIALQQKPPHRDHPAAIVAYLKDEGDGPRALTDQEEVYLQEQIEGHEFCLHPLAFFQSNRLLASELLRLVGAYGGSRKPARTAVDLYSGSGFFSLPLAAHFRQVISVEEEPYASALALQNGRLHQRNNVEWIRCSAERWIEESDLRRGEVDLLVVDPPREGLSRKVCAWVLDIRPARVIYVSCSPPTLVRDLRRWLEPGDYRWVGHECLDMFPQTYHMEIVTVLDARAN